MTENAGGGGAGPPPDPDDAPPTDAGQPEIARPQPAPTVYDPGRHMDGVRARLAYWLLALVAALAAVAFLMGRVAWDSDKSGEVEKLLALVFTPVVTIFATVIGFYFGQRSGPR